MSACASPNHWIFCAASARITLGSRITPHTELQRKVTGRQHYRKIEGRFGGNLQELRSYVTDLVSAAANYLSFDPSEAQKTSPGIPAGVQTAVPKMSIVMPRAPQEAEFSSPLKEAFLGARSSEVEIISSAQRVKIELHMEGDGSQFLRIFVPLQEDMRKEAIPCLLLGKVLDIVQQTSNESGVMEWVMVTKDKDGFDADPIFLGKSFSDSVTRLDATGADLLHYHVNGALSTAEFAGEGTRVEVQRAVVAGRRGNQGRTRRQPAG